MAAEDEGPTSAVSLNIYDLSQGMARQLSAAFLGTHIEAIYHTGVVVYGKEYWFGNGIERGVPGRTYFGPPLRSLGLGQTSVPEELFEEFLVGVTDQFNPSTYSLLRNNCNHFSDEAAQFLVGSGIPKDIVDLPNVVLNSPQGQLLANMLQGIENQLRNGVAPTTASGFPEIRPLAAVAAHNVAPAPRVVAGGSSGLATSAGKDPSSMRSAPPPADNQQASAASTANPNLQGPAHQPSSSRPGSDDAKKALEEEIKHEFALLMALGSLGANEAAAEALRRVMAKRNASKVLS